MRGDQSFANAILGFARACHKRDGMFMQVHTQNLHSHLWNIGGGVFEKEDIEAFRVALETMISNAKIGKAKQR